MRLSSTIQGMNTIECDCQGPAGPQRARGSLSEAKQPATQSSNNPSGNECSDGFSRPHPEDTTGCAWSPAWELASKMHSRNLVSFVSKKSPIQYAIHHLRRESQMDDLGYRVNIAEMQRMYLRVLQIELIDTAVALQVKDVAGTDITDTDIASIDTEAQARAKAKAYAQSQRLPGLLRNYTQAVQDYEYMTKVSQQPFDFFIASSERYNDNWAIQQAIEDNGAWTDMIAKSKQEKTSTKDVELEVTPTGPWDDETKSDGLGGTRNTSARAAIRRNIWWKMAGAVVGGAFLVGPMWLLVLRRELYLNLGVATGFVFAFGFLMVGFVDNLDQVFASTLAYAAVLMVFVGVMFDKQFPEGA